VVNLHVLVHELPPSLLLRGCIACVLLLQHVWLAHVAWHMVGLAVDF
jgi:hypothetical protein